MWQPSGIVYGPILSRRLGRSLGINLMGTANKVCSFDCIYCECGPTIKKTLHPELSLLPTVDEVVKAVSRALGKPHTIDNITFSGNGEPTLHPQFLDIVQELIRLRNQLKPTARLAVLTNASTLDKIQVVNALNLIDKPIFKMDAGDEADFMTINHPANGIQFAEILENILRINHRVVQTIIFQGKPANNSLEQVNKIGCLIKKLMPEEVQIYSLERAAWHQGIQKVSDLTDIKHKIQKHTAATVTAYHLFD